MRSWLLPATIAVALASLPFALARAGGHAANACNPCGGHAANACNPCGGHAANACNPCGGAMHDVDPSRFLRPEGAELAQGDPATLAQEGARLWSDTSLSTNGLACATCHRPSGGGPYAMMRESFATEYPHAVKMAHDRAGVDAPISAAEMVQFCLLVPMAHDPLPWGDRKLAALTAYVQSIRPGFHPAGQAANPCSPQGAAGNACNPCGPGAR